MSKIEKKGNEATVIPQADVVAAEVQNFRTELLNLVNNGIFQIKVDLEKVEMIDSSGIGVFISAQNSLKKQNGSLKVVNVSADILKMFRIMRLDKHFEVTGK
ncbi:MAG: hypothetical protein A2017_14570 [Lentisphaerae bacterium GWF2_44_16]|nr:MAG: hypothetical protein A2017_14570 [Lentisphaerae bacterium GWF2_44_16]